MTWYQITAAVISGLGVFSCSSFIFRWVMRSGRRWMNTEHGWFLMTMALGFLGLFLLIFLNQIFGDWWGRLVFAVIVFSVLLLLSFWFPRLLSVSIKLDEEESRRKQKGKI